MRLTEKLYIIIINQKLPNCQWKIERFQIKKIFEELVDDDLKGHYYPLTGMTKEVQKQLIQDHFLFKEGDR